MTATLPPFVAALVALLVLVGAASGVLTMHVLDLADPQAMRDTIRGRYERRLMEIFR